MLTANNNLPSISPLTNSFTKPIALNPILTATRNGLEGVTTSNIVKPIAYSNNKATIAYTGENIVNLAINGTTYYLSNKSDPDVGFYYINEETSEIEINTGYDVGGLTAIATIITTTAKLNKMRSIPITFRNYLVIGEFNFSQSFEGHPSGSFSIRCHKSQYKSIRTALKPGTPLNLQGIDYRVRSLARVRILDGLGHELVNISLQGYWERQGNTMRSPLDEPIRESELINKGDCGFEYNYRDALLKVGVSLRGGNIIKKVSRDISSSQTITARSLLEDSQRLLVYGYYVDWSSRAGITLRKWESPSIFRVDHLVADLSKTQEFPTITINENGHGAYISGCYLAHELNNAELQLDQDPNGGQDGDEYVCLIQGDRNPQEPPQELRGAVYYSFNYDKLRSPALCFDNGERKKSIHRCQMNGSDIEVTEREYGWVFNSTQIYDYVISDAGNISYIPKSIVDVLLSVEWQLVKQIKTQYIYDQKTGYFLNAIGSGWELTRDLKETEDKEAIQLAATIALETDPTAIAELTRHLQGYTRFYKRQLNPSELFELEDLAIYYPDLAKPDEGDDGFIPSLYPKVSEREENSLIIRKDPRTTEDENQPDLIIGRKSKETQKTEINSTAPEKYLTWNPVINQQGTNLEELAESEYLTENSGRPGLQKRLNKQTGCYHRKKDGNSNPPKYLLSTPGVTSFNIVTQTLSYPGAYTIQQAIAAATLDYQIKNSKDSFNLEIPLGEPLKRLKMGDVIIFEGNKYRVFGYSENGKIQVDGGNYSNITLSIGKEINLTKMSKEVPI